MPKRITPDSPRKVRMRVLIDEDVAAQIETIFFDPMKRKARYGAKSDLVNQLLKKFIREAEASGVVVPQLERKF